MKVYAKVGSAYHANYEALAKVMHAKYDKEHFPSRGLFVPRGFPKNEAAWFVKLYIDPLSAKKWENKILANGEIWEHIDDPSFPHGFSKWRVRGMERATFTKSSPTGDWVFEGVYKYDRDEIDSTGKIWRVYVQAVSSQIGPAKRTGCTS